MNPNPSIQLLEIPKWGLSMEEGTIISWLIAEGDSFAEGDLLAEVESSKIVNELEAHIPGTLRKILADADETLPVGAPIAIVADASVSDDEIAAYIAALTTETESTPMSVEDGGGDSRSQCPSSEASSPELSRAGASNSVPAELAEGSDDSNVHATLHARRLAQELEINLNKVSGTGRNGRISRQDVLDAIIRSGGSVAEDLMPPSAQTRAVVSGGGVVSAPAAPSGFVLGAIDSALASDTPLSGMRRTIATRLAESKQDSPHFRVVMDVEIDALLAARKRKNDESSDARISVNDYLIKACARALLEVPECNVQFDGQTIRQYHNAHISVAVALDTGLISPIVRDANEKSLTDIAKDMQELTAKARDGALSADEFQGGTFTVSNLGGFGVKHFDAIINPPQGSILAVGAGEQRTVVRDGKATIATVLILTLSSDHRIIDGALAARFLGVVKGYLEDPAALQS